jgi:hypothetical protein
MDMSKLSTGAKAVLGGTVLFLIVSFFNWQEVKFGDIASAGVSMWHGWGFLAGLIALALLAWEVSRLMGVNISLPITPAMTTAFLGLALVLFTLLKVLVDGEFRTFWAWLGLLFSIVIAAGAVLNMQAAGQSFGDMKEAVTSGAAAATAAAKSATDSSSSSSSSAPSSAPSDVTSSVGDTAENAVQTTHDAVKDDDAPAA